MNIIFINPEKLTNYSKNSRKHSVEQVDQIVNSIRTFGFNVPVEINENFLILSGHARVQAAKKMGLKEIPVIVHNHLENDAKQKGYILAANKIAMNAEWDYDLLTEELSDLKNLDDFDLTLTGFSEFELNELLEQNETEIKEPKDETYFEVFEIIIECSSEGEQESLFNRLTEEGLKCRVLSM